MARDTDGSDSRIYHHDIDPDEETASVDIVRLVAEIEACDSEALPPFWKRIDGLVSDVFSDPPEPEAQVRIEFTYAGYRITVDQSGAVELIKVADKPSSDF